MKKQSIQTRFDSKVMPVPFAGCHMWTASTNKFGYGKLADGYGGWLLAHRFAFEQANGKIPNDKYVLHTCDNPSCVNPEHMYLGTYKDNAQDRVVRGRSNSCFGELHGKSKLTSEQVVKIRKLSEDGESSYRLGKTFGVNPKSIRDIVNRNIWKHI